MLLPILRPSGPRSKCGHTVERWRSCRQIRHTVPEQGDAKVFKKYSQIKLQMKREALGKLNRNANEREGF
jgi:hypothetical protein